MLIQETSELNDTKFKFTHQIKSLVKNKEGAIFKVSIRVPFEAGWVENMKFIIWSSNSRKEVQLEHMGNIDDTACFRTELFLETSAVYHYCFSFESSGNFMYFKKKNYTGDKSVEENECWKLSVGFETPKWAKDAVMYHIFVDRFKQGRGTYLRPMHDRVIHERWEEKPIIGKDKNGRWNTDFFGGNLKGIEESLSYIKSLGASIIYLSPIVKSQSNHRYDTADYEQVDPYAGTNDMLKELCKKAHSKGMYIVLDAVFNHTGNDSKYFNEYANYNTLGAYQSENSPYYSFYKREYDEEIKEENFAYWWGMKNLPVCDGNSERWKKYILGEGGIIDQWFSLGIDGLRLDVADELTDEFIEGIRKAVHRNKKDGLVLGEVWKNPMRMSRGYLSSGKGMDSVMNYLLVDALIRYYKYSDIEKLKYTVDEILTEYPEDTIHTLMNFTSTHDISRLIEICGSNCFYQNGEWAWNLQEDTYEFARTHEMTDEEVKKGKKILKSYVTALAFMPGIFSIFYGDEAGLKGIGNLMNRSTYPWRRQDKETMRFFKELGSIRKKYDFLAEADLKLLTVSDEGLIFERKSDEKSIIVITSRSDSSLEFKIPEEYVDGKIVFSVNGSTKNMLSPYGAIVVEK